jgi:hypothetical protein
MSGYQRPRNPGVVPVKLPRLTGSSPDAGVVNAAFTILEQADTQNVKRNMETPFPSLLLLAPDGSSYRVTVDISDAANPTLALVQVPPLPGSS